MFSKAYIKECIENAEKLSQGHPEGREWWVPRFGDWAIERHSKDVVLIVAHWADFVDFVPLSWEGYEEGYIHTGHKKNFTPLPAQRQLIGWLEERGWRCELYDRTRKDYQFFHEQVADDSPRRWRANICFDGTEETEWEEYGPDAESALLRAVLAVMKGGEREGCHYTLRFA